MSYVLGAKSLQRLEGVHPDLVRVFKRAIKLTQVDFAVIEGVRTKKRQAELVASGASKTMNSRHLTGHAVDIAPYVAGSIRWDWPLFHQIAPAVKQAAKELGVPIEWGGDWRTFKDGPHWQLPHKEYPA
jgi:peptidoglycan L-alanyl-D-glutamate endopeptidase CwlK